MKKSILVGMYFISKKDGKDHWQGEIVDQINEGVYLVQLFDWVMGMPSNLALISIDNFVQEGCELYESPGKFTDRETFD